MKTLFFQLLIIAFCFASCKDHRVRKKAPLPTSGTDLITGCYYISQDSTQLKRSLVNYDGEREVYFINPEPIFTVGDFEEASVSREEPHWVLRVKLNDKGKKAFAMATENYQGKRIAFIIGGGLAMAPVVYGKIPDGTFDITGNFSEDELNAFLARIEDEMYEDDSQKR